MNTQRPWASWIISVLAAAAAAFGARYGIPVPPPPAPTQPAPTQPAPTQPAPTQPGTFPTIPRQQPDTLAAIGRITFGTWGCTATVTSPRRDDGRYWVLTAAHCIRTVGEHGTLRLRDGRTVGVVVASIDKRADCAWLITESNAEALPVAELADTLPPIGSKLWHAGYGVDNPGNREDGTLTATANSDGQIEMRLSVSSGDSGGGIAIDENGRIVSCVCCTTAPGKMARVWGASPDAIRRAKPVTLVNDEWRPLPIPTRPDN